MDKNKILNEVIDKYYEKVPHSGKSDFARHISNPERECALRAMDAWAEYCIACLPKRVGTLEFENVNGTYFSCDSTQYNDLYMKTDFPDDPGVVMFAVTPIGTPYYTGDVFYLNKPVDVLQFLTWYITTPRQFSRPNSEGFVAIQQTSKGRVRLLGMGDWIG